MIESLYEDESVLRITAEDQEWDRETLKQLRKEHGIIFMSSGDGAIPVMVRQNIVVLGAEDDGAIFFHKCYSQFDMAFSKSWIDSFVSDLKKAKHFRFDKPLYEERWDVL